MSQALRKLTGVMSKSRTTVLFINQIREKIGVMYGNPEVTPGGRALKFYASVRIEVRRLGDVKVAGEKVGNRVRVKVTKNKVAPPFREAEVEIVFGRGIDRLGDLVSIASDLDVVQKSGSWFAFGETRLGQGKEKAVAFLAGEPSLEADIRARVLDALQANATGKGGATGTVSEEVDLTIEA
jgi:recombination protein RecA